MQLARHMLNEAQLVQHLSRLCPRRMRLHVLLVTLGRTCWAKLGRVHGISTLARVSSAQVVARRVKAQSTVEGLRSRLYDSFTLLLDFSSLNTFLIQSTIYWAKFQIGLPMVNTEGVENATASSIPPVSDESRVISLNFGRSSRRREKDGFSRKGC